MPSKFARDWERRFDALVAGGLRPVEASAWARLSQPSRTLAEIARWKRWTALDPLDAWEWRLANLTPRQAAHWTNAGWTCAQYLTFHRDWERMEYLTAFGSHWLGHEHAWRDSGIPPERCLGYFRLGHRILEARYIERTHARQGTDAGAALRLLLALHDECDH